MLYKLTVDTLLQIVYCIFFICRYNKTKTDTHPLPKGDRFDNTGHRKKKKAKTASAPQYFKHTLCLSAGVVCIAYVFYNVFCDDIRICAA